MKDIIKHFLIGLIIGLIASWLMVWGYNAGKRHCTNTVETITDTITDTITNWNYDTIYLSRLDTIKLPVIETDTILKTDSILVQIPISTTVFDTTIKKEDYQTRLKATVTGFNSTLDEVLLETTVFEKQPVIPQEKWYNHIAPACGVGIGTDGKIGLFIGIGYTL